MTAIEGQLVDGELPDQSGRAEPFGIIVEQEYDPETCTCEIDLMHLQSGRLFARTRNPDPADPCPLPGHDRPERHRYA